MAQGQRGTGIVWAFWYHIVILGGSCGVAGQAVVACHRTALHALQRFNVLCVLLSCVAFSSCGGSGAGSPSVAYQTFTALQRPTYAGAHPMTNSLECAK